VHVILRLSGHEYVAENLAGREVFESGFQLLSSGGHDVHAHDVQATCSFYGRGLTSLVHRPRAPRLVYEIAALLRDRAGEWRALA